MLPRSLSHFSTSNPRFGWSKAHPPDYRIALRREDVKSLKTFMPTDEFVARVAEKIIDHGDDSPRFALITGVRKLLGPAPTQSSFFQFISGLNEGYQINNGNDVKFQVNLGKKLVTYFKSHAPEMLSPYTGEDGVSGIAIETLPQDQQVSHSMRLERLRKYSPAKLHAISSDGLRTTHFPHMDEQDARFLALQYGDFHNILGGYPRAADPRQMVRDNPDRFPALSALEVSPGYHRMKPHLEEELLENYTLDLTDEDGKPLDLQNDSAIVLYNNTAAHGGVYHAVTPITAIDKNARQERPVSVVQYKHQGNKPPGKPKRPRTAKA